MASIDRMQAQSTNSFVVSTPPPLKRLQAFREKLLTDSDDWKFDLNLPHEMKSSPRSPSMPKLPSPKRPSPMCSPIYHHHHSHRFHHHCHPMHFHECIHPHDHMYNRFGASAIHENRTQLKSPPKYRATSTDQKSDSKSPICSDQNLYTKPKKKMRRSRSCPKELFSISSGKCSDNEKSQNESMEMGETRAGHEHLSAYNLEYTHSPSIPSSQSPSKPHRLQQHSRIRTIPKIRVDKPKSKTPNSMDEFLSSKLVRSNHAAKLRHKSSRQKIHELAEEKIKATLHVSHFIPKCHTWNVRDTPAWKTFLSEE